MTTKHLVVVKHKLQYNIAHTRGNLFFASFLGGVSKLLRFKSGQLVAAYRAIAKRVIKTLDQWRWNRDNLWN